VFLRRLLKRKLAMLGLLVLLVFVLTAALAPYLAPFSPTAVNPRQMLEAPGPTHPLGTDDIGRDVLSRLLYAGRASLSLALGVALLAVMIGGLLGALAGFFEGRLDAAVSALVDTMLSIPPLALAMVASAFIELTTWRLILILSLVTWPTIARLVRGQVLSLKQRTFVEAAYATGNRPLRVLFVHILPNTLTPVFVAGTLLVAYAILVESALSFLGFGLPPPTATWGGMLNDAQLYFREAPWLAVFPGLAITLVVASINFAGEGLREALDPRATG
jgi:peptide/nickel transport system permease protein